VGARALILRSENILPAVAMLAWAYMLWTGVDLLNGVAAQHVPGYPAPGQIQFLVGVPTVICTIVLTLTLLSNVTDRFWRFSHLVSALSLFALFPYLFVYGGGV
jgi:hypothetical protein